MLVTLFPRPGVCRRSPRMPSEDADATTPSLSLTYDRKEGFGGGGLESAPCQRRLAHVLPDVRGGRGADGEASPEAVEPTGDSHPVSLPGHTQLLDGPVRTKGFSDSNCGSCRWQ